MMSEYTFNGDGDHIETSYKLYKTGTPNELISYIKDNIDEIKKELFIESEVFDSELLIQSAFGLINIVLTIVFEKRDCLATNLFKHNPEKMRDLHYLRRLCKHQPVSDTTRVAIIELIAHLAHTQNELHQYISDIACQILTVIYDGYIVKEIDKKLISLNVY